MKGDCMGKPMFSLSSDSYESLQRPLNTNHPDQFMPTSHGALDMYNFWNTMQIVCVQKQMVRLCTLSLTWLSHVVYAQRIDMHGKLMWKTYAVEIKHETQHEKNNKMNRAPSEDSDQPGHPPSLISLSCALSGQLRAQAFFVRTADAQADLSFRWAHRSVGWFCRAQAQMSKNMIFME